MVLLKKSDSLVITLPVYLFTHTAEKRADAPSMGL